jgi:hypothetical protein
VPTDVDAREEQAATRSRSGIARLTSGAAALEFGNIVIANRVLEVTRPVSHLDRGKFAAN